MKFKDYDVYFFFVGFLDLVFEVGGKLYFMNFFNNKYKEVKIDVVSDLVSLVFRIELVVNFMLNVWIFFVGN